VRQPSKYSFISSEIAVVLALSLGASAIYSIISFAAKALTDGGIGKQTTALNRNLAETEWVNLALQLTSFAFGLAPVALVLFLIWREGRNPLAALGITKDRPLLDFGGGILLAAVIGIPGILLYLASRLLGWSAKLIPSELDGYWWTIPVLLLAAAKASIVEETIVVAYLFDRMTLLGVSSARQIWLSATLRGSYHLYQGFGAFVGNLAMGLVFGYLYKRFGRLTPLLVAHFVLDVLAFVGFAILGNTLKLP
jgi:membrane protease YdiL (CAAX protease family)